MTDSNTAPVEDMIPQVDTDNLDDFAKEFFGTGDKEVKTETPAEEVEVAEDEPDTPEDDTSLEQEEASESEEEGEDETPEPPKEEKPKSRFQERISELTNRAKQAEAERDAAIARYEARLAELENKKEEPAVKVEAVPGEPTPADKNEDGTDKYPLGEFDPAYLRDLARHAVRAEREALKAAEAQERERQKAEEERQAIVDDWNTRLSESVEKFPDFPEKNVELQKAFADVNPEVGNYLALTIMSMDHGPEVLYHLASNIDEARKLTKMSAAQATLALGRLEARFVLQAEDKAKKLKVSNAPKPPERLNKGTHVSKELPDDTDDLDAFSRKFFKSGR